MSFPDQLIAKKKTLKRKRRWNKKKTGRRRPPHTQEQLSADRLSDWAYVKNLRREWEIVVYSPLPYPELQRDYRFNVKLAGSLIASPIGIKSSHGVTPKTRCSNFPSFHRSLLSELLEFLYGPRPRHHDAGCKVDGDRRVCQEKKFSWYAHIRVQVIKLKLAQVSLT